MARDVSLKRVTVLGAARSGIAAARLLAARGAKVLLSEYGAVSPGALEDLAGVDIEIEQGGHTDQVFESDFLVTSPGVPTSAPPIQGALARQIPVYSEIELASWFCPAKIIAITGSNGKTTTTELIGHILRSAGRPTTVCGNIGTPFSSTIDALTLEHTVVLEVSSFQLDFIDSFRPDVSIILNITPDHLDRYDFDMDRYAASKLRICSRQAGKDVFIYSMDDERLAAFVRDTRWKDGPQALGISASEQTASPDNSDAAGYLKDGSLTLNIDNMEETLMQPNDLALRGRHNVYNSLAAAVAARVVEVRSDVMRESLRSFEGVPHRLETVREVDGVRYVNDSKATNVNAVWYALESFSESIVLIAGGRDKGNDYHKLAPLVKDRVRAIISIGEAAETIQQQLGPHVEDAVIADTLKDAVHLAHLLAQSGDVVLLSPACSSLDMFASYEDRGDQFKQLVSNI
ncbi:MAG: UDP-N-acetylmuramoyl-L-alanine--D-glutamate ligase [Rhodothermales bacterium]